MKEETATGDSLPVASRGVCLKAAHHASAGGEKDLPMAGIATFGLKASTRTEVKEVDGRKLAYELRGLTAGQRAAVAAVHYGAPVVNLTNKQRAGLYEISTPTLKHAESCGECRAQAQHCSPF